MRFPVKLPAMSRSIHGTYRFARAVLRPLMTPWIRFEVEGEENIPTAGPCILVLNHLSNVDPLCVCWFFMKRDMPVRFLAKKSLFSVPGLGPIIRGMGLIPVDREGDAAKSLDTAKMALARGEIVVIMPEGTFTQEPQMWPMSFKTGAARLALDTGVPIVPVAQWGAQAIMDRYESKKIDLRPGRLIRYRFLPALDISDLSSELGSGDHEAVVEATSRMQRAVTGGVEKLRGTPAPAHVWKAYTQAGPWWQYEQKHAAKKAKKKR